MITVGNLLKLSSDFVFIAGISGLDNCVFVYLSVTGVGNDDCDRIKASKFRLSATGVPKTDIVSQNTLPKLLIYKFKISSGNQKYA